MKNYMVSIVILVATFGIVGCYSGQSVTKGTIVMRTATEAHINLGGDDGIQVGDTLSVWRDQTVGKVTRTFASVKSGSSRFSIRITRQSKC